MICLTRYPSGELDYFIKSNSGLGSWTGDYNEAHVFDNFKAATKVKDSLVPYFLYGATISVIKLGYAPDMIDKMNQIIEDAGNV